MARISNLISFVHNLPRALLANRAAHQVFSALLVILIGISGRAITDKVIALRGGAEAVAAYAQLLSLTDLVAGVSLAGIGVALVSAVARSQPEQRFAWLRASLSVSLVLSGVAALAILPLMNIVAAYVVPKGIAEQAWLAVLVGWLLVATTLVMSYLVGTGQPGRAALWTTLSFIPPLVLLAIGPFSAPPVNVLLGQGLFGLLAIAGIYRRKTVKIPWPEMKSLLRFAPAGIAIGVLSPIAMLLSRARIAEVSSWALAAQAQTVWRVNDWVLATAGGLLYIYFLPRLSAASSPAAFWREMKRAAWTVVVPAGVLTLIVWMTLPVLAATFYRQDMAPTRNAAALLLVGDWLRVVSWLFLYGLYARHAARAVTMGEFCSVPLFALLLWFSIRPDSLEQIGLAWAVAYLAYAVFNGLSLRKAMVESLPATLPVT